MFIPAEWADSLTDLTRDTEGMSPAEVCRGFFKGEPVYLKSIPKLYASTTYSVKREGEMMSWLAGRVPVPRVIAQTSAEGREFLLMSRLAGRHIDSYLEEPEAYVSLLAEAVGQMQAIPIEGCSFCSDVAFRLKELAFLLENGLADTDQSHWEDSTGFADPQALFDWLKANIPGEELVFSHGDIGANFIVGEEGIQFYDLARAGAADKWLDIAFCVRDIRDAFEDQRFEDLFFDRLGLRPDYEKINYFILLDELF